MDDDKTKLEVVKECVNYSEAAQLKEMLESNGIKAALWDENMSLVFPSVSGIACIKVVVNKSDLSEAKKLLKEFKF